MTPCIRLSPIAQPATTIPEPSNMEHGRESYAQSIPLPPKLQHPLEQPNATDISFSQHHPQSSTPNLSPFPGSDMEQVASPAKIHQRPELNTRVSNEAHDVSVTAQPSPPSPLPSRLDSMKFNRMSGPPRRGLPPGDGEPPPGIRNLLSEIENDVCASFCRCVCYCLCCGYRCGDS